MEQTDTIGIKKLFYSVKDPDRIRIGKVTLDDIEKALRPQIDTDPKEKLLQHY